MGACNKTPLVERVGWVREVHAGSFGRIDIALVFGVMTVWGVTGYQGRLVDFFSDV